MSADQVKSAFGEEGIPYAADKLGIDTDTEVSQLKDVLPGLLQ